MLCYYIFSRRHQGKCHANKLKKSFAISFIFLYIVHGWPVRNNTLWGVMVLWFGPKLIVFHIDFFKIPIISKPPFYFKPYILTYNFVLHLPLKLAGIVFFSVFLHLWQMDGWMDGFNGVDHTQDKLQLMSMKPQLWAAIICFVFHAVKCW